MSRILNFIFSHYVGLFFAGVVFVSTSAQAQSSGALNVASVESSESQPPATPSTQTPALNAPASQTTTQTQPIAIKHLSKKEAQIVRDLHRRGIYW
jgi:hypothetical protein